MRRLEGARFGLGGYWHRVIESLRNTGIHYSRVSNLISLFLSIKLRRRASRIGDRGAIILDAGCGPGDLTIELLNGSSGTYIICLDAEYGLIHMLRDRLGDGGRVDLVVGVFEERYFRDSVFNYIFTSFSIRDSINMVKALSNFNRYLRHRGKYVNIDVGRPDNPFIWLLFRLYLRYIVPLIASIYTRSLRNPWGVIIDTVERLPTNNSLSMILERIFGSVDMHSYILGCMLITEAIKSSGPNP